MEIPIWVLIAFIGVIVIVFFLRKNSSSPEDELKCQLSEQNKMIKKELKETIKRAKKTNELYSNRQKSV